MLPLDKGSVVSPDLRAYRTSLLSVVDASVIPLIPATHLQATVHAVTEKVCG